MKAANVHYLEYESFEFTTASGRTWIVYGSPVSVDSQMHSTCMMLAMFRHRPNMQLVPFNT
jgi:hypothetical protein